MSKALVLCVDDDIGNVNVRELLLQHEGYDTIAAYEGATALRVFATAKVDIVILDYAMPGLKGAEVARLTRGFKPEFPYSCYPANRLDPPRWMVRSMPS